MGVRLYCGINEKKWNHHPVSPGRYACVSPVYGKTESTKTTNSVFVPDGTIVIQDSGAFSDGPTHRLSMSEALYRQIEHADKYGYNDKISHRASYDVLIDEVWNNGNRHKRRWSTSDAEFAVNRTIAAAEYMSKVKDRPAVLSAQGVDAMQYMDCSRKVVDFLEEGDFFGMGGWCITGKMPRVMMPVFRETIVRVIPFLAKREVKNVHIWGVIYAPALGELLWMCNNHDIDLSTDSAGPQVRPAFGEWGYADWRDNSYIRPDVSVRGLHRAEHVRNVRDWLSKLEESQYYKPPKIEPTQLYLL